VIFINHKKYDQFIQEPVNAFGSINTQMCWFRKPDESSHFMLRRFEIGPKGFIGNHSHPEEHQIYILKGPIELIDQFGDVTLVEKDEFVYCNPQEVHGYRNPNDYAVSFICGIPKLIKN
jgi:quercetin dioxygenase-like cupin family protein